MPIVELNPAPTFAAIMMKLQMEWDILAKESGLKFFASKIVVDDVLLYGLSEKHILAYSITVLDVLKHYRATLKMRK